MKKAVYKDRKLVVEILARSFDTNQSVNYIVRQDRNRKRRTRALMAYAFDICHLFGNIYLSEDKHACALILYPDKKRATPKSMLLDLKLIITCVGLRNIQRTLAREALIKKIQINEPMSYLWFIGVQPDHQNMGIGSTFLRSILEDSDQKKRPVYLETSTVRNLSWYQKFGFEIYHEQDISYRLYFLKRSYIRQATSQKTTAG